MNALVSIDVATLTPATVFAPGGVEAIISKIETEVSAEVFTLDTAEGRERIKSVAYKVARSKTALDDMGKELVSGIKAQAAAIDADRRTIRDRLDALKERVRGPLTAWEEAEAERVSELENAIVFFIGAPRQFSVDHPPTAQRYRDRIQSVRDILADKNWQEFRERAETAAAEAIAALEILAAAAEQAERDQAELAELRRQKAEREEADRIAAAAAVVEAQARLLAEAKAEREAREAAQAAEREGIRKFQEAERERQRAEQAEKDKAAAVAAAIETERRRQEAEAARVAQQKAAQEAAEQKRQANQRHRAKVQKEARAALTSCFPDLAPANVDRIIEAISTGLIPHVSITY